MHLFYLPLWPVGSVWVTNEPGGADAAAFPIRLHARSVAAAYLRTWGPALAVCLAAAPALIANGLAVAVAALCGWSWTSRSRRGVRVLQRSDFDRVALGSRCDPAWMTSAMRDALSRKLTAQLAERDGARPPDDVARFGPRDPIEGTVLEGRLQSTDQPTPRQASWLEDLRRNPSLDARAFAVDLERENEPDHRFALLFLAMFAGVAVVGWSLWITGVLRRRRQPSA